MSRRLIVLLAAVVVIVAVVAIPASAQTKGTLTLAVKSDAFVITLTKGGKKVTSLAPGKYTFVLVDKTAIHNVHLLKGKTTVKGVKPNVANAKAEKVATAVAAKKGKTLVVTLSKGTYRFVCDPHAANMKGSFKVG